MKKKVIIITIISLLLIIATGCLLGWKVHTKNEIKDNERENLSKIVPLEKRIILADILKKENDILITEGNVDNTQKIIEDANIKEGMYIQEASREQFLEIINSVIGENYYTINSDGYLVKSLVNKNSNTSIEHEIERILERKKTLIISIGDSYKAIINGMQLDMMIERTSDVEIFDYNDNIKIAIINSRMLNNIQEDRKEVYETILMSILKT